MAANDLKLLSGRVKKVPPTEVDANRYDWLNLQNAEPDLGVPSSNGSFFVSTVDGTRSWTDKLNTTANGVSVNGELVSNSLTVTESSDLGDISNVKIEGGNVDQVISTDGAGNLTFVDQEGGVDGGQTPTFIPEGETFTVVEDRQAFFQLPVEVDGDLVVDGVLIEIPESGSGSVGENIDITGNITANVITANTFQGDGGLLTNLATSSGTFIENGSSEVRVDANSDVRISVAGVSNVLVTKSSGANIDGYANVTGNLSANNISATTLNGTLTTNAQPNITSVGNLDSLTVSGNISGDTVSANALVINGETTASGNIVPDANNTHSLGAPDKVWKEIYLGANTLFIDNTPLGVANGSLTFGNNAIIVSGDANVTTDEITEGQVNLFYNSNRANAAIENFDGNINTTGSITASSLNGNVTGNLTGDVSGNLSGNVTGNVTGQVSDISNHSTSNLTEGTNLYFTTERVRGNVSASGDLSYDSANGVFSVTTYKSTDFDNDLANKSTTDLTEGANLYFTEARARNSFSGGTGVTVNSGTIAIGQDVATNANVSFNRVSNLVAPTSSSDATNKQYVDEVAQGLKARTSARVLTDTNLDASYDNGTSGVGATLTANSNVAFPTTDGVDSQDLNVVDQRILVTAQTNAAHNGLYVVQVAGDGNTPWQLRRCVECDTDSEVPGSFVFVSEGTTYGTTGWVAVTDLPFTIGTTEINWTQFSGSGTFTAGTGLTLTGSEFSVNSSQTQVTELGTLTSLDVDGNVIAQNITSNTGVFTGNGAGLTNLIGANVTGIVANATHAVTANTVVDSAQPNITSVGTLTSLDVTGNITCSGTIDGRDIASDGSKLDGIETGATVDQTITAGNGLAGGGTGDVTLSHANTSSQSSVDNSGGTVIQDISVDTYGHVTSIGSTSLSASDVGALSTSGKAADSNLLDGINSSQFLRSDTDDTMTGTLSLDRISSRGSEIYIAAGEALSGLSDTSEKVYIAGENGVEILSSTDNMSSGLNNRAIICDSSGDSSFPGTVTASQFTETSTIELKENINPIVNSLDLIQQLDGVTYDRKDGSSKNEAGLVAEDVEKVLPNLIGYDENGKPVGIHYTKLTAYLIEAVKELTEKIKQIDNK